MNVSVFLYLSRCRMTAATDLCRNHSALFSFLLFCHFNRNVFSKLIELLCSFLFNFVSLLFLRIRAHCRFSVELELNFLRKEANASTFGLSGATHIEDMFYLFKLTVFVPKENGYEIVKSNSREAQMIRKMTRFITNFAKNGYCILLHKNEGRKLIKLFLFAALASQ